MDPELYVFPKIENPTLKITASTALFALVVTAARLLLPAGGLLASDPLVRWIYTAAGYSVFLYASYLAWRATREKNRVEDPQRQTAKRLLEDGAYARVRHPMYGMFIQANAGLGLAVGSWVGLGFSLLSLALYILNGIFEERASLIPQFGDAYRAYMQRVPARYFTPGHAALLAATLGLQILGLIVP